MQMVNMNVHLQLFALKQDVPLRPCGCATIYTGWHVDIRMLNVVGSDFALPGCKLSRVGRYWSCVGCCSSSRLIKLMDISQAESWEGEGSLNAVLLCRITWGSVGECVPLGVNGLVYILFLNTWSDLTFLHGKTAFSSGALKRLSTWVLYVSPWPLLFMCCASICICPSEHMSGKSAPSNRIQAQMMPGQHTQTHTDPMTELEKERQTVITAHLVNISMNLMLDTV